MSTPSSFTKWSLHDLVYDRNWVMASRKLAEKPSRAMGEEDGNLPIHLACKRSAPASLVRELLQAFPDSIRARTYRTGSTPLDLTYRCYDDTEYDRDYEAIVTLLKQAESLSRQSRTNTGCASAPPGVMLNGGEADIRGTDRVSLMCFFSSPNEKEFLTHVQTEEPC